MIQNKRLFGSLSLVCMVLSPVSAKEIRVEPEALSQWSFYGEGFVAVDAQQRHTVLVEAPGSKGVMLVSPESYDGDLVVSYEIRPLTPESVLVAMLSVSDRGADATLHFPENYDGAIIIEASDAAALDSGHLIFRMRGTSERIGVCLIKDLRIDWVDLL